MGYIKKETVTVIICDHPKVERVWEWGGMSMQPDSEGIYYLSVLLKDGEQTDFAGKSYENVIGQAEEFLNKQTV
jgi:hypothetical protein